VLSTGQAGFKRTERPDCIYNTPRLRPPPAMIPKRGNRFSEKIVLQKKLERDGASKKSLL
jgi:hypothetical protein